MSPEGAHAALRTYFGDPDPRSRGSDPRWLVTGPHGAVWFELRNRDGVPMLMIRGERGCHSEICDVMFLELRSPHDVALLARRLGVHARAGRTP